VQIWVVDTGAPGFADECERQVRLIREADAESDQAEYEAWFDSSDKSGWT
jgi:hypothetical protein